MSEENMTFTKNQDGTINTVEAEGQAPVRYAKESDLIAVKGASETAKKESETQIAKHLTDLAESNRLHEETRQKLLQEQARIEQLGKDTQETASLKTKVGELETTLSTTNQSKSDLEQELLGMKRTVFGTKYKVDPEKVKEMTLDQLREAEKNFESVGFNPAITNPANYDGKEGAGGTGTAPRTPLEQASEELRIAREIQTKKRSGVSITDPDYKP